MIRSFYVLSIFFVSLLGNGVVKAQEKSSSEGLDLSRTHSETLDLTRKKTEPRPEDSTPRFTGSIVVKSQGEETVWPYLKVNNIEYRLHTTDPKCQEQIAQCEKGDVCTVKGEMIDGAEPILKAKSVKIESYGEQHLAEEAEGGEVTTVKGCKFKRDNFNHALGETWKSPKGIVWGELELNADGSPLFTDVIKASDHCTAKGGRLPTKEEWKELAGCFETFSEHTAPLRNLNLPEYFSSTTLPGHSWNTEEVFETEGKSFRNVRTQLRTVNGDDKRELSKDDKAFVRCVGAHSKLPAKTPDTSEPYQSDTEFHKAMYRKLYGHEPPGAYRGGSQNR